MPENLDPEHDDRERAERARLEEVSRRLSKIETERAGRNPTGAAQEAHAGQSKAWRILSEFFSAVAAGSLAGHFLVDRLFDTSPWGLVVGVFVGFGFGIFLMARSSARMQREANDANDER
jgi:ATP synthase protein I